MFWRVENTLICIIRLQLGSFSNFARFCQNKASLELFRYHFFKKVHQKGLFGVEKENSNFRFLTADSRKLQTVALKIPSFGKIHHQSRLAFKDENKFQMVFNIGDKLTH